MSDPLFDIESRYRWHYADDCLRISDAVIPASAGTGATLEIHGELAGRMADGLQMLETSGLYMQPILSLVWHTAAAGAAGLVVPGHEGQALKAGHVRVTAPKGHAWHGSTTQVLEADALQIATGIGTFTRRGDRFVHCADDRVSIEGADLILIWGGV